MTDPGKISSPAHAFLPFEVEGFDSLAELALDMRWSRHPEAGKVWQQLDPVLWKVTQNPWLVLQTISRERLQRVLADSAFRKKVDDLISTRSELLESPAWFQNNHPGSPLNGVAYFSMEFMLSEALPIYSGGLGNVAGDQLKAASDLGVPVIGVGLLFQQGYFRQVLDRNGMQQALFPYNDPGQLPIAPLRDTNGEWLRVETKFPEYSVWLRAWQVEVGRVKLYLLDSNDPANLPAYRGITSELYGGGSEVRMMQELALGIGGWRLLKILGIEPDVCHLNEGHAAFAVLERARSFMEKTGQPFDVAMAVTRTGNLFTTHTAVAAGFDRFAPQLMEQYLGRYSRNRLGIPLDDLLALGRQDPEDQGEYFNMAFLALHGSGAVNGVSRLHGEVSRRIFQPLFQRWPEAEVPVGHVTNGVHMPTWQSGEAEALWGGACGKDTWMGTVDTLGDKIQNVSDPVLWQTRASLRESLIGFIRERLGLQRASSGGSQEEVENAKHIFDINTLTLGFARRFATYKRPNLLLHDPERLLRILCHPQRPVQLIIAGKAHPEDQPGQDMIRQWTQFILRPEASGHVVFLSDYDMLLTENLVHGVDVWINTPRRPWEACGTSGMKVLVNGGINLSELDGWWAEAYEPDVGWALGDMKEHDHDAAWDAAEAEALYNLLEQQVVPEFYTRDANGIPTAWVEKIRRSMARLTPRFSANRAIIDYTEKYYIPAAAAYHGRAAGQCANGNDIVSWQKDLDHKWNKLRFGEVKIETGPEQHSFEVQVYLDGLEPDSVRIELYAAGVNGGEPVKQEMLRGQQLVGAENGYTYSAQVRAGRPAADYTARAVPFHPCVAVPLEASQILWQK